MHGTIGSRVDFFCFPESLKDYYMTIYRLLATRHVQSSSQARAERPLATLDLDAELREAADALSQQRVDP